MCLIQFQTRLIFLGLPKTARYKAKLKYTGIFHTKCHEVKNPLRRLESIWDDNTHKRGVRGLKRFQQARCIFQWRAVVGVGMNLWVS
jgi:hypothetical protein